MPETHTGTLAACGSLSQPFLCVRSTLTQPRTAAAAAAASAPAQPPDLGQVPRPRDPAWNSDVIEYWEASPEVVEYRVFGVRRDTSGERRYEAGCVTN